MKLSEGIDPPFVIYVDDPTFKVGVPQGDPVIIILGPDGGRGPKGGDGNDGDDGDNGLSAYEIAVEAGFVGTVEQWLDSLNGEDGNDSTVPGPPGATTYRYGSFAADNILENEILMDHVITVQHTLLDNFEGAQASVVGLPIANWIGKIFHTNGVTGVETEIGSLTINTIGVPTFSTIAGGLIVEIRDVITLVAPAETVDGITRLRWTFEGMVNG